ncbi:MAG: LacI family DNA-binding transcriptional regulator [Candidatus Pristimantibacillus sp.]
MKPTIRDVAKLADVSISTVSRVMNAPDTVVEVKRQRVLDAIEQLNYQPNAFARGLIYKRSHTLGVLIPDIRNPYYGGVIRGMEDAAKQLGYNLMICNTDREAERMIMYLDNFNKQQVDGILFASDFVRPAYYEAMLAYRLPVVLVSTESQQYDLPSVKIDEEQAAYDAVKYLIESGHRDIGFIGFTLPDPISGQMRYNGFIRAINQYELHHCIDYVAFATHWFEEAYEATATLFDRHPHLTAIFACSDEFAMGTISCLHSRGIHVPQQVSVIGFDNIRMSWMTIPKLTTIAQPMYQIGFHSVQKLHELIQTGTVALFREWLPHELIIRESTLPLHTTRQYPLPNPTNNPKHKSISQ